jgi:hypothetical protein
MQGYAQCEALSLPSYTAVELTVRRPITYMPCSMPLYDYHIQVCISLAAGPGLQMAASEGSVQVDGSEPMSTEWNRRWT